MLRLIQLTVLVLMAANNAWAVDSYRFLHVTIDTPWFIFIFLFFLVFSPMILSAVIHWRTALKRDDDENDDKNDDKAESGKAENKHD
jgi:hypothetical protein